MVVIFVFLTFFTFIIFEVIRERRAKQTELSFQLSRDDTLIASIGFIGEYKEIGSRFEKLYQECKEYICGPSIIVYHHGIGGTKGTGIEVCFPVNQAVETDEVKSRILEGTETVSILHYGPHKNSVESDRKFEILSRCSHVFPEERIEKLRTIYEQNRDIDKVLKVMYEDQNWYSHPIREGNIIYLEKNPFNCKVYEAEERMLYCRCPMLRKHLYEIPSTFCYCGAGCYRQQWEGIFGTPVQIEILKSLTKGDDVCQFAIHLPS